MPTVEEKWKREVLFFYFILFYLLFSFRSNFRFFGRNLCRAMMVKKSLPHVRLSYFIFVSPYLEAKRAAVARDRKSVV